jgi:hypothetical protein
VGFGIRPTSSSIPSHDLDLVTRNYAPDARAVASRWAVLSPLIRADDRVRAVASVKEALAREDYAQAMERISAARMVHRS